ncbi:MAG: hypothetical protein M1282_15880, partial [Chloroflexi bacterium]|nr:hypothetical protein [Chloroflexota bacterium]
MNSNSSHWRWFFILAALEAGAAFFALALIPHEGSRFSISRLTLLAALFAFFALWIYFSVRPPKQLDSLARPAFIVSSALLSLMNLLSESNETLTSSVA